MNQVQFVITGSFTALEPRVYLGVSIDNGYGLTSVILDASYCGVPQKRNRFFLIGEHSGKHNSLLPYIRNKLSKNPMTIRDYLGESLKVDYYYNSSDTFYF